MALSVSDSFDGALNPHWNRMAIGCTRVVEDGSLRLILEESPPSQAISQLDDYINHPRKDYRWAPPVRLMARLRTSHPAGELLGTAGIGFWNNFGPLWSDRMEINPNWVWLYYASPESNLSLTDGPVHGWKASIVRGGKGGRVSMAVTNWLMQFPRIGKALSGVRMPADEVSLDGVDFTVWHDLIIEWLPDSVRFDLDGETVMAVDVVLPAPMGFACWIDNNFASCDPAGDIQIGSLAIPERQVFEISQIAIETLAG
jgi:hypothetical protein